jgi:hypothetical protein
MALSGDEGGAGGQALEVPVREVEVRYPLLLQVRLQEGAPLPGTAGIEDHVEAVRAQPPGLGLELSDHLGHEAQVLLARLGGEVHVQEARRV